MLLKQKDEEEREGVRWRGGGWAGKKKGGKLNQTNYKWMQLKQRFVVLLPENNRFKIIFIIQWLLLGRTASVLLTQRPQLAG